MTLFILPYLYFGCISLAKVIENIAGHFFKLFTYFILFYLFIHLFICLFVCFGVGVGGSDIILANKAKQSVVSWTVWSVLRLTFFESTEVSLQIFYLSSLKFCHRSNCFTQKLYVIWQREVYLVLNEPSKFSPSWSVMSTNDKAGWLYEHVCVWTGGDLHVTCPSQLGFQWMDSWLIQKVISPWPSLTLTDIPTSTFAPAELPYRPRRPQTTSIHSTNFL